MTAGRTSKGGYSKAAKVVTDSFDLKIVDALQENGRITNAKLALRVGLSESACFNRVKRLERDNVISGYVAILNKQAIASYIVVYAHVVLESDKYASCSRFEQLIKTIHEVTACEYLAGQYDYMLTVLAKDMEDYSRIMEYISSQHGGVIHYISNVVIKTVKDSEIPASYLAAERYRPKAWDEDA